MVQGIESKAIRLKIDPSTKVTLLSSVWSGEVIGWVAKSANPEFKQFPWTAWVEGEVHGGNGQFERMSGAIQHVYFRHAQRMANEAFKASRHIESHRRAGT